MTETSLLGELVTSRARANLLLLLTLFSDDWLRFRDIQRRTGVGSRSPQRELARLEALELPAREGEGWGDVRYRARTESARWLPVWSAVRAFAEPAAVLDLVLAGLGGVDAAFLYGSIARGDARPDSDVDLFLVAEGIDEIELACRTIVHTDLAWRS
ncbi:MAG: nucleotidyltransferase domain-containing protein, partial [Geminicoccales bacterium]